MKPLNPAIREKKRYLLIEGENLEENIQKTILDFIGVLGMSETSLKFIQKNKNSVIISINREALNKVRASFAVNKSKIRVKKVSGTLKSLRDHKP
ncbi:MAG: hypothetical protein ACOC1P_06285 [Minisyncoccales bacterium]